MLGEARRELLARAEEVRARLREAERAAEAEADRERVRQALAAALGVRRELRGEGWRPAPTQPPWWRDLAQGDRVKVKGLNMPATVLAPPGPEGRVEVIIGSTRARFDGEQLQPLPSPPPAAAPPLQPHPPSADAEVNLLGHRVEPALEELEVFLDRALLKGHSRVRIVHGRGTGALRQAIRERLARHPLVKAFGSAEPSSGGDGATMVELD